MEAIARRLAIGKTVTYEHVLVARRVAHDGPGADAGVVVGSKELLPCEKAYLLLSFSCGCPEPVLVK